MHGERHSNVVSTSEFERQIEYLAARYQVLTGPEFLAYLDGTPASRSSALITFDDGYQDNFTAAFPVLRRYGVTAVFFVSTQFVGARENRLWLHRADAMLATADGSALEEWAERHKLGARRTGWRAALKRLGRGARDDALGDLRQFVDGDANVPEHLAPMTWDEIRAMADAGMTIGSHTASHQILAAASAREVGEELDASRADLEARLGRPCLLFSYPNGTPADFGFSDLEAVRSAGYACAFTQINGVVNARSPRYALPRIPIPAPASQSVFLGRVSGLHATLAPRA